MRRLLLFVVLLAVALAVQAPAWLLQRTLAERTAGLVGMTDARGTFWNGLAQLTLLGQPTGGRDVELGTVQWNLAGIDWQRRALRVEVIQSPGAAAPATFWLSPGRIDFAGTLLLPGAALAAAPWTAGWRFGGEVALESEGLSWIDGSSSGTMVASWGGARLDPPDLTGGFALGEVIVRSRRDNGVLELTMTNRGGDVDLRGVASTASGRATLDVQPGPIATPAQIAWLQSHTMGRSGTGYSVSVTLPGR